MTVLNQDFFYRVLDLFYCRSVVVEFFDEVSFYFFSKLLGHLFVLSSEDFSSFVDRYFDLFYIICYRSAVALDYLLDSVRHRVPLRSWFFQLFNSFRYLFTMFSAPRQQRRDHKRLQSPKTVILPQKAYFKGSSRNCRTFDSH